jgi:hypothetical protein
MGGLEINLGALEISLTHKKQLLSQQEAHGSV